MRALAMLTATGNDPDARNAILDALRTLNTPTEPPPTDDPEQRIADLEQYIQDAQPTRSAGTSSWPRCIVTRAPLRRRAGR